MFQHQREANGTEMTILQTHRLKIPQIVQIFSMKQEKGIKFIINNEPGINQKAQRDPSNKWRTRENRFVSTQTKRYSKPSSQNPRHTRTHEEVQTRDRLCPETKQTQRRNAKKCEKRVFWVKKEWFLSKPLSFPFRIFKESVGFGLVWWPEEFSGRIFRCRRRKTKKL